MNLLGIIPSVPFNNMQVYETSKVENMDSEPASHVVQLASGTGIHEHAAVVGFLIVVEGIAADPTPVVSSSFRPDPG